jgi:DNA (cytosine-5)-methyltransferase 1
MTIGSLFSGIGGLERGLEAAGLGPVIWQAEQDEYCLQVLEKHWPDVKRYTDVHDIDRAAKVPDILCGGFPCQDISIVGSRKGLDGERSGLWTEFARIIRLLRPRIVVVENVPQLRRRGMGRVLGDLASCGYNAEWDCLPASAFGAPHRRDRLFIIASLHLAFPKSVRRLGSGEKGPPKGYQAWGTSEKLTGQDTTGTWVSIPPPDLRGMDDGSSNRVHRTRALGNAVVPLVAEFVGQRVAELLST